jgi:anhydro-N-acetylmuramic acid kinase
MPADLLSRARAGESLRALGLMSGTSLDGVDVALIETDGETIQALGPWLTVPYVEEVQEAVRRVFGAVTPSFDTRHAERLVTEAHRDAVAAFFRAWPEEVRRGIDVIGFHGQTITHRPESRFTWQIGDAAWLAAQLGIPVVADFRMADIAAGGQGAPLVPVYHQALVREAVQQGRVRLPVAVLNIGGVANVTWIGEDGALLAFDTGPGNAPLDDWIRRHQAGSCDQDGQISAAGHVDESWINQLLTSSYFSKNPPKSLDRNDFSFDLKLPLADGAATLAAACAAAATAALAHMPQRPAGWVICGGGSRNHSIINMLKEFSNIVVEDINWNTDAIEGQAFGFLAVRSLRNLPLSFPMTTSVPSPQTGGKLYQP